MIEKKKFKVLIREVHISHRFIAAKNEEEAKKEAEDARCTFLEYSHTLDKDTWTVEPAED